MEEKEYNLLDVMPSSEWLKKRWWHRLALVLWSVSFVPLGLYLILLTRRDFSFRFFDFISLVLFGYLTVPLIYRVFLYITFGDYKKK